MAVKTISLRGSGIRKEAIAAAAITPGELIERTTATAPTVQRHSTAVGNAQNMFAVEDELQGNGIDVDYAAPGQVLFEVYPQGAEVYALLEASSAAVVIGDFLVSAGDGSLRKQAVAAATPDTAREAVVGIALEAVTPIASKTRCKVELL